MKNRKHFFFLVVIWTILSAVTFSYGIGLESTVDSVFADGGKGTETVSFQIEGDENVVISASVLQQEIRLNDILNNDENFSYCFYLNTTSTVNSLLNTELAVDADQNAEEGEHADGQKSYKIRTLFLDEKTAEQAGLDSLLYLFDISADYNSSVPMALGFEWFNGNSAMDSFSEEIVTEIDNYKMQMCGYINAGTVFQMDGVEILLDKYMVVPLGDLSESDFPDTQEGRKRWYDVYRVKNQGYISSDMSPNALQKYLDDLMEENGLSYRLLVEGADHGNRLIFRNDIGEITDIVTIVGYGALALSLLLLMVYLITNYSIGSRYLFLSYLTGTGKAEFIFVGLMQLLTYFVLSAVPAFAVAFGLCRITSVDMPAYRYIILPAAVLAGIGAAVNTVRIILWDAGKKLRNI